MFEKEAEEYTYFVKSTKERWNCDKIFYADIELAYQKGAEFGYNKGKAETALLSQHILDLQKDKGNLTDRVRELEQQIEKMKCCGNCKHYKFQNDARYYTCVKDGKRNGKNYRSCEFNLEKWEGRQKKND